MEELGVWLLAIVLVLPSGIPISALFLSEVVMIVPFSIMRSN